MARIWSPKNPEFALTLPLALVCLLLGVILMLESVVFQRAASVGGPGAGAGGSETAPERQEPDAAFELPPPDEFSAFVDRPLFMEGRRPAVESDQAEAPKEEELTPLALSLMGVTFGPHGQMAILAEASGKNRRVKLGGTIDGWRLIELKPDRVTLLRGQEKRDLPLLKPRTSGPQAPAAPGAQARRSFPVPRDVRRRSRAPMPPEPPVELTEPDAEEADEASDAGEESEGGAEE